MLARGFVVAFAKTVLLGCGRLGFEESTDAAPMVDASEPFCITHANAAFCEDFDDTDPAFPAPWDDLMLQGGTIVVDPQNAVSLPHSLVSVVPGGSPNNNRNYLTKAFAPQTSVRVGSDLLVEATGTSGFAELLKITLVPPPAGYREYLCALNVVPSGKINLEFYANDAGGNSTFPWALADTRLDAWNRLQLEMVLGPSPVCNLYDADGVLLASVAGLPVTSLGQAVQVGLVDVYSAAGPIETAWGARHDNVLVELVP